MILKAPVTLEGKINGKAVSLKPVRQNTTEKSDHRVVFVTESKQDATTVTIKSIIESDGMIRFIIDVNASGEALFEDIRLRVPLNNDYFQYLHYLAENRIKGDSQSLPKGEGLIWGSEEAQRTFVTTKLARKSDVDGFVANANVVNSFLPMVWVGSGDDGLAWFAESDESWQDQKGKSIVELKRTGGLLEFNVNFIVGAARRKSLHLDFGLQATPVKPMPEGWRTWQEYNGRMLHEGKRQDWSYYDTNIPAGSDQVIMFDLDFIGFDTYYRFSRTIPNPQKTREIVRKLKDRRYIVLAYTTPSIITPTSGFPKDWEDWRIIPKRVLKWDPKNKGTPVDRQYMCHNAPGNYLHMLEYIERLVKEYDLDGAYVDVPFFVRGCMAPGCSYVRADGQRQPTFRIFLIREFYKKLASIFVRHGKYPYVLVHNSGGFLIPAYSFCWAGKPGEFMAEINYEQNHIEYFRDHLAQAIVEFNPRPWGLVPFCMDDIKFTRYTTLKSNQTHGRKDDFEEEFKQRYMGIPLLHDGLLMNWCSTPKFSFPIYKARMDFGIGEPDVKFHAYWDSEALKTSDPEVKLSYYTRDKAVMLVLVNFSDKKTDCTIKLPPAILSRIGDGLVDPISRETIAVQDGSIVVPLAPQMYRLLTGGRN